jgi:WD40 repeat protein
VTAAAAAIASDGRALVVTGSADGTLRLWNLTGNGPTQDQGAGIQPMEQLVTAAVDDLNLGWALGSDGEVSLWDMTHGRRLRALDVARAPVVVICGTHLAGGDPALVTFHRDGYARIWKWQNGALIAEFEVDPLSWPRQAEAVPSLRAAPLIASVGHDLDSVLLDLDQLRVRRVFGRHKGLTTSVATGVSAEGRALVATGGLDARVNLWETERLGRAARIRVVPLWCALRGTASRRVERIVLTRTGAGTLLVLVLSEDGQVRVFKPHGRIRRGRRLRTFGDGLMCLWSITFGGAVQTAVAVAPGGRLQIWPVSAILAGSTSPVLEIHLDTEISDVALAGTDTLVAVGQAGMIAIKVDVARLAAADRYEPASRTQAAPAEPSP